MAEMGIYWASGCAVGGVRPCLEARMGKFPNALPHIACRRRGGGAFRSNAQPLFLVSIVRSPTWEIFAWMCGWWSVAVTTAWGQLRAQWPIPPHAKHCMLAYGPPII